jgi:hypothetical protein
MAVPLNTKIKEAFRAFLAQLTDAALTAAFAKDLGTFTAATNDVVTFAATHGLSVGQMLRFTNTGGALPGGLAINTTYFVKTVPTTLTVTLSATLGGATLDITGTGTGTHRATLRQAYAFYRGIRTGLQALPAVCVSLPAREPALECDDSPLWNAAVMVLVETGVQQFEVNTGSSADYEDAHDAAVAAVELALNPEAADEDELAGSQQIRVFANSENVTNRPAVLADGLGFYLADFPRPNSVVTQYDPERHSYVTILTWQRVQVQNSNCDA